MSETKLPPFAGIDPGPICSHITMYANGMIVMFDGNISCRLVSNSGAVPFLKLTPVKQKLKLSRKQISAAWDMCSVETVTNMGMPIGDSTIKTIEKIGVLRHILCPESAVFVPRVEIKTILCGSPRARDANIRAKLISLFGEPGTKKSPGILYGVTGHYYAALAAGIAGLVKRGVLKEHLNYYFGGKK